MATSKTKGKLKHRKDEALVEKQSNLKIFFTLVKGFIVTAVIFIPKGFKNGGWAFSSGTILMSFLLTVICVNKLLSVYSVVGGGSYTKLSKIALGAKGKIIVDIALAGS